MSLGEKYYIYYVCFSKYFIYLKMNFSEIDSRHTDVLLLKLVCLSYWKSHYTYLI